MNEVIPCCGTCRYSSGSEHNMDCIKNMQKVTQYEGCLMYEPKENRSDEKKRMD